MSRDNRSIAQHYVHEQGHRFNATLKDLTDHKVRLDAIPVCNRGDRQWSSDVDRARAEYHLNQRTEKREALRQQAIRNIEWDVKAGVEVSEVDAHMAGGGACSIM